MRPEDGGPGAKQQAESRVPPEAAAEHGPDRSVRPEPDVDDVARLIIGMTGEQLEELRHVLGDRVRFAKHVGDILGDSFRLASDDPTLRGAMAPVVTDAVMDTAARKPKDLADAIAPALGPAIRRAVVLAMRGLVESIETAVEHTFTARGLKWRLEALRSGRPFAEIVLKNTLSFRVEHVFLLHAKTGLLLRKVSRSDAKERDATVVAGMLEAIRNFVIEAFAEGSAHAENQAHRVGEYVVVAERSGSVLIACVVRGSATHNLPRLIRPQIEAIATDFAGPIADFEGDSQAFDATEDRLQGLFAPADARLEELLVEERLASDRVGESKKRRGAAVRVVLVGLLILAIAWLVRSFVLAAQTNARWDEAVAELRAANGVEISSVEHRDGQRVLIGLRDPLAVDPKQVLQHHGFGADSYRLELSEFYSVEAPILERRLRTRVPPPPGVDVSVRDAVLHLSGRANRAWIQRIEAVAVGLPGIDRVDKTRLMDETRQRFDELRAWLHSRPVPFEPGSVDVFAVAAQRWPNEDAAAHELRLEQLRAARAALVQRIVATYGELDRIAPELGLRIWLEIRMVGTNETQLYAERCKAFVQVLQDTLGYSNVKTPGPAGREPAHGAATGILILVQSIEVPR